MSNTPITDHLRTRMSDGNLDLDDLFSAYEKLELAANELYSALSIWVNAAGAGGYSSMQDVEALADFELLRKL